MIYCILGLMFVSQILIYYTLLKNFHAALLKKEKQYVPCVNYSAEDPTTGHAVLWSIGDIWFNYETLRCFMLVREGLKRSWKVIGATSMKYTKTQRRALDDPKLVKQYEEDMKRK